MAVTVELPLFLRVGTYQEAEVATIEVPAHPTPATDDDGRPGLELRIDFAEFRLVLAGALRAVADEFESENSGMDEESGPAGTAPPGISGAPEAGPRAGAGSPSP